VQKVIVYDLEIEKAIHTGGAKLEGIQYVDGWENKRQAGISVVAAYAEWLSLPMVFGKDNLHKFQQLVDEADLCVGFNNEFFDDELLDANGVTIPKAKSWDILQEWVKVMGKRVKLGDLASANCGAAKSDDGGMAPIYWQNGQIFRVIAYCLADVMALTVPIWNLIKGGHSLKCPYSGRVVRIKSPLEAVR
jgi:hypothetical protein